MPIHRAKRVEASLHASAEDARRKKMRAKMADGGQGLMKTKSQVVPPRTRGIGALSQPQGEVQRLAGVRRAGAVE